MIGRCIWTGQRQGACTRADGKALGLRLGRASSAPHLLELWKYRYRLRRNGGGIGSVLYPSGTQPPVHTGLAAGEAVEDCIQSDVGRESRPGGKPSPESRASHSILQIIIILISRAWGCSSHLTVLNRPCLLCVIRCHNSEPYRVTSSPKAALTRLP